jgi:hypothetical protein
MKRDWLVFLGTLLLATWVWHSEQRFLCYYTVSYQATNSTKISWMERVMFAAALSSAADQPVKRECPRVSETLGHAVGI